LQFYALLPLLALGVGRVAGRSLARAAAVIAAFGLASLAVRYLKVYDAAPIDPRWRLSIAATFVFFTAGMLLALLRLAWERRAPRWVRGPLASSDLWLLASVPVWTVVLLVDYDLDALLCPAAVLTIGACVLPLRHGPLTGALAWWPLAAVGVASYSLYLWHVPVLSALMSLGLPSRFASLTAVGIPLSILVALLSYRLIEEPFLRLRGTWSRYAAARTEPLTRAAPVEGELAGDAVA
jgi:peptidoglycan/LPS O-acetylase OafA/YrhL